MLKAVVAAMELILLLPAQYPNAKEKQSFDDVIITFEKVIISKQIK